MPKRGDHRVLLAMPHHALRAFSVGWQCYYRGPLLPSAVLTFRLGTNMIKPSGGLFLPPPCSSVWSDTLLSDILNQVQPGSQVGYVVPAIAGFRCLRLGDGIEFSPLATGRALHRSMNLPAAARAGGGGNGAQPRQEYRV